MSLPLSEGRPPPGASPPFAGNEANVIGLTVRVDATRLPPLFIAGVNYMKHIPKAEAQGLTQEAAVLGLVVIKQGPRAQGTVGQGLAGNSRKDAAATLRSSPIPGKGSVPERGPLVAHTEKPPNRLGTKSSVEFRKEPRCRENGGTGEKTQPPGSCSVRWH